MAGPDQLSLPSRRLASVLRAEIEEGAKYPPGTRLPSYRTLAAEHGVARNTVQAAVRLLAAEGLVAIRASSGAVVRDPDDQAAGMDFRTGLADMQAKLRRARQEVASAETMVSQLLERLPHGRAE